MWQSPTGLGMSLQAHHRNPELIYLRIMIGGGLIGTGSAAYTPLNETGTGWRIQDKKGGQACWQFWARPF